MHVAVDTLGHLLAVRVTAASDQERGRVAALAADVRAAAGGTVGVAFADQGYTGETPAGAARAAGTRPVVVKHTEAKRGFVPPPRRGVAERTFAWRVRSRRLARGDERLADTLKAWHWGAFIAHVLRRSAFGSA